MTEAYTTLANTILYYGSADGSRLGAHVPFNFGLITDLSNASSALDVRRVVDSWMGRMRTVGAGAVRMIPNWVVSSIVCSVCIILLLDTRATYDRCFYAMCRWATTTIRVWRRVSERTGPMCSTFCCRRCQGLLSAITYVNCTKIVCVG